QSEALRNLNRNQTAQDDTALFRHEAEQQGDTQKAVNAPVPEKPLTVEQPQIKLPREVTEMYLVNRDRTELYNERTGETSIYINNEKNQLKTKHSDFDTVDAMIKIAEQNKWESITVKGTPEFRKLAWEMASIQGIEVKGYKPTKQEIAIMEARKARIDELKATNRIEGNPQQKQSQEPTKPIENNREERQVRNKTDLPQ
ncbi:hypothetical protein QG053_11490, partial [Kingella kingae]|uniref:LPD7 domain-containing protein n=1 Tax=Kingella kingae TaxID=504 RepID=UPI00254ECF7D